MPAKRCVRVKAVVPSQVSLACLACLSLLPVSLARLSCLLHPVSLACLSSSCQFPWSCLLQECLARTAHRQGPAATNCSLPRYGDQEIKAEIGALIRQITASVSFLPLIDEPCAFDLLVYTDDDVQEPQGWEESDPRYIVNADEVKLRSFSTKVHRVDACVAFKSDADDL